MPAVMSTENSAAASNSHSTAFSLRSRQVRGWRKEPQPPSLGEVEEARLARDSAGEEDNYFLVSRWSKSCTVTPISGLPSNTEPVTRFANRSLTSS